LENLLIRLRRARKMEPKKDLTKAILDKRVRTPSVISASGTATRTRTPVQEGEPVEEEEDLPWDELEVEDVQVLPDEVLGRQCRTCSPSGPFEIKKKSYFMWMLIGHLNNN
ncbi:unnamed protein product, partial [Effrenium voratum]